MLSQLLLSLARGRRVPRKGYWRLSSKRGGKGYYKGKGAISTGHHTSLGAYKIDEAKLPKYIVPDLTGFQLKPYVAHDKPAEYLGCTPLLKKAGRLSGRISGDWQLKAVAEQLSVTSPCKINLFLRVMGRRADGFHDLASLFHVIDLSDSMELSPLGNGETKDRLECDMCGVPTDESNLVIKALNLFREKSGSRQYFDVKLHKVVPHGAGLGGGSANAATALWAANELCGRPASESDLLDWSADIGSDISVFFSKGAAYCTGRGEIVRDVPPPLPLDTPLLLVKPEVGLATGQIFKQLDLDRRSSADPEDLLHRLSSSGMSQDLCVNDLEPPAFETLPELADLKGRLQREGRFSAVFMTGSGSTIVCVGSDEAPEFLQEEAYSDVFVSPARLIVREEGEWY